MLEMLTIPALFSWLLVFCRIGSAFVLMPGIGEVYVSPQIRIIVALFTSLALTPVLQDTLPAMPANPWQLSVLLLEEIILGIILGLTARIIISTLHITGMVIAYQSGLSSAVLFDTNQGGQGSIVGNFMTLLAMLLFFATNMHQLLLAGYAESYTLFPPAQLPEMGNFSDLIAHFVSDSFAVAIKIAAPQLVVGLLLYLASGILARLMPSLQVFFVIMPLQIFISFLILAFTLSASMMWFIDYFNETMSSFLLSDG